MRAVDVAILGCGNSLAGDDAVGLEIVVELRRRLRGRRLPGLRVKLTEIPGGLDAIEHILDHCRVIIIDAVLAGTGPGQVVEFDAGLIPGRQNMAFSLHGLNLADALLMMRRLYPERTPGLIWIVGVEIGKAPGEFAGNMSEEVRGAVPAACAAVLKRLGQWSQEVTDGA